MTSVNSSRRTMLQFIFSVIAIILVQRNALANPIKSSSSVSIPVVRGGASTRRKKDGSSTFGLLALAIKDRLVSGVDDGSFLPDVSTIEKALNSLSKAQTTLKTLDGAAHEAYQRTHRSSHEAVDTSVSGRARRSADRVGSAADAFLAAELCDLLDNQDELLGDDTIEINANGTLVGRNVIVNANALYNNGMNLTILVLFEPMYCGGAGLDHGGINGLRSDDTDVSSPSGRLLVIIKDAHSKDLIKTVSLLDNRPLFVNLHAGLVANEVASVQGNLYKAAGNLLRSIEPTLRSYSNNSKIAIHFVGRSLAGGVASLAATILDGSLPMPDSDNNSKKKRGRKQRRISKSENVTSKEGGGNATTFKLEGHGRGRTSAVTLGSPPCLSANIKAAFVTSIIFGDDVVCRITSESLDHLCQRTRRAIKGGFIGRQMGWMTDTVSLTVSSLKTHAHGSEGEEARLVVPGQVYLIRPRRLGGACSIHEVGGLKGGREALRAAVLWQLHDVLLSGSLWRHHQLESYVQGLDRVQLRGAEEST